MNKEDAKSFLESKKIARIMAAVIIMAGIIFVFHIGEEFGYKKAELMDQVSGNYYKTFGPGDPRKTGPLGYLFDDQTGTHGVAGKVANVTAGKIVVEDNEGIEKTVTTDSDTIIKKQRNTISINDIQPDDFIVVIGSPNANGEIDAKIIRVVPPPITQATSTNTQTSSSTN